MKTPIQDAIDELEEMRSASNKNSPEYIAYCVSIQKLKGKLSQEKQHIKDAYCCGYINTESAEDYFNQRFKTNEQEPTPRIATKAQLDSEGCC